MNVVVWEVNLLIVDNGINDMDEIDPYENRFTINRPLISPKPQILIILATLTQPPFPLKSNCLTLNIAWYLVLESKARTKGTLTAKQYISL